jgi:hypothetical protein
MLLKIDISKAVTGNQHGKYNQKILTTTIKTTSKLWIPRLGYCQVHCDGPVKPMRKVGVSYFLMLTLTCCKWFLF